MWLIIFMSLSVPACECLCAGMCLILTLTDRLAGAYAHERSTFLPGLAHQSGSHNFILSFLSCANEDYDYYYTTLRGSSKISKKHVNTIYVDARYLKGPLRNGLQNTMKFMNTIILLFCKEITKA